MGFGFDFKGADVYYSVSYILCMTLLGSTRPLGDIKNGLDHTMMMSESSTLARISAYVIENKLIASESQVMTTVKVIEFEVNKGIGQNGQETTSKSHRLDWIYNDEPLRFEKDPLISTKRMQAQDPLEEVDLAYISVKFVPTLKARVLETLKEFKDYFA